MLFLWFHFFDYDSSNSISFKLKSQSSVVSDIINHVLLLNIWKTVVNNNILCINLPQTHIQHSARSRNEIKAPITKDPCFTRVQADQACHTSTRVDEMKWMRWRWRRRWNQIMAGEHGRNAEKILSGLRFVHHEPQVEGSGREFWTPTVEGECFKPLGYGAGT